MSFGRRVVTATGAIAIANGLARVVGLAAAPALTRLLGPGAYGIAAVVGTLSALLGTVALLGIDMSYARFFFGGVPSPGREVERFCWRFSLSSALLASLLGILIWIFVLARVTKSPLSLGVIVGITGLLTVVGTMAQTRVRLQGRYSSLARALVFSGLVNTASTLLLAYTWRRDAWALLVGSVCGAISLLLLLRIPSLQELVQPSRLHREEKRAIVALGVPGAGTALMYWAISSSDRWIIAFYHGTEMVGGYTFAAAIGLLGLMLNSAIVTVWFPEASRSYEEDRAEASARLGRMWTRLVVGLALVWLTVAMSGGDFIRLVADARFHSAAIYVPWIAGGACFYGVAQLSGTGLILSKDMRPIVWWWLAGTLVSIGLNIVFVPQFGALAAAVVMCASFGLIAGGVMLTAQRRLALQVSWALLARAAALTLAVGALGTLRWDSRPLISIGLKFPIGLITALAISYWTAPDWVMQGARSVRLRPASSK